MGDINRPGNILFLEYYQVEFVYRHSYRGIYVEYQAES